MKPGAGFFTAALFWLFLGGAAFFSETLLLVWLLFGLCLLPFIIMDGLVLLLLTDFLKAERSVAGALALGEKSVVKLTIRRSFTRPFLARSIRLFDIYPDSFDCRIFPVKLARAALDAPRDASPAAVFEYPIVPLERGPWEFSFVQFLFGSPLGFWRRKVVSPCSSRGRTFPDFKKIAGSGGDLRGVLEQAGLKDKRRRGQGMEFMSLREYQKGDTVKSIDWRATGRRGKFIVREYQEEQDQQLLFLLDSGYRLHRIEEGSGALVSGAAVSNGAVSNGAVSGAVPATVSGRQNRSVVPRTQFDSALEAAFLLSWVALKHGDGVALGCFGAEERWLPPRKGMSALPYLMRSLYDIKSAPAPSSLFSALEGALARLRRRTFIIMISNFREEDGESLSWILKRIRRRHLLLLVSLREAEAEELARRIPQNGEEALETAAAFSYLSARTRLYKNWEHLGLLTLECSQA
ncbi:MAG: DUF58 domain-containing protein, partial [Treponema sp.]|nr:DUF58 domain-containing protein [Treponema sp.]